MKQEIMDLYPSLFSGVGTIKNAMVHLDVKLGAVPVVCDNKLWICTPIYSLTEETNLVFIIVFILHQECQGTLRC